MDYPHEGAALARRLAVLALLTVAGIALAIAVAWVVLGLFVGGDDEEAGSAPAAPVTAPSSTVPPSTTTSTTSTTSTTTTTTTSTTSTLPEEDRVLSSLIGELSLERKVEQLLVIGGPGPDFLAAIEQGAGDPCVGGLFVADRATNWVPTDDPLAAEAALKRLTEATSHCAIRPLVATDAEVGPTVKVPVIPIAGPDRWAADWRSDPDATAEAFHIEAVRFLRDVRLLGVHVNLGVVADVDVDDRHWMALRGRTFGSDATLVDEITERLLRAHCDAGLAGAVKHFPNQGSTLTDPHIAESRSSSTPQEWAERGRVPYVDTRAPLVMTGHVVFEGVDGGRPASVSHEITTGWLRDELGYDRLVITDDLQAMRGAAIGLPAASDRAVAAIAAGADLLLFVSPGDVAEVIAALFDRALADPAFAARIDESVDRILRLKTRFGLVDGLDPGWFRSLCG